MSNSLSVKGKRLTHPTRKKRSGLPFAKAETKEHKRMRLNMIKSFIKNKHLATGL